MYHLNKLKQIFLSKIVSFISRFYLRKPDRTEFLQIRVDSVKVLNKLALNELLFFCNSKRSKYLTSLNIEVTNICNLNCFICPVNKKMTRPKGMMNLQLFDRIISECGPVESIQFSQWGEPLLNPYTCDMIHLARKKRIKTLLTTNGTLLNERICFALLDAGLNRITFSVDGLGDTYSKIRGYDYSNLKRKIMDFRKIRDKYNYPTKMDVSMVVCEETVKEIERFKKEFEGVMDRIQFIPIFTIGERKVKCRELWRGSLTIYWDGLITVCCVDYNGELVVGDTKTTKISDILNAPTLQKLRHAHVLRKFPKICQTCSEYAYKGISPRFS